VLASVGADPAALLRAGIDELRATNFQALDGAGVLALLDDLEVHRRQLDAVEVQVLAAAEERRRDGEFAAATLTDLLTSRLRMDPREAARRVNRMDDLRERRTLVGEPLPPILPATAAALADGAISAAHADVIIKYVYKIDALPDLPPTGTAVAEGLLVDAAQHEPPRVVAQLGETLLARLDPDGREPTDARLQRERSFTLVPRPDGSATLRGQWTPELTAACQALLDTLAAPVPDEDGSADPRTATQRRHDALLDVFKRVLRGNLAPAGGTPLTVLVRFAADQVPAAMADVGAFEWEGRRPVVNLPPAGTAVESCAPHWIGGGIGRTAHGGLISLGELGCALCEAEVDAVAVNQWGGVLAFGRSRRLATKAQRLALAARDGGCSFPSCTRPAAWCEAHHVRPWHNDGDTDLDNLTLVCSYHHRHFERLGWCVIMAAGVPMWIPPPWVDPDRTPRRNTAHHLADYDFAVLHGRQSG
jgi:hypothetical protein